MKGKVILVFTALVLVALSVSFSVLADSEYEDKASFTCNQINLFILGDCRDYENSLYSQLYNLCLTHGLEFCYTDCYNTYIPGNCDGCVDCFYSCVPPDDDDDDDDDTIVDDDDDDTTVDDDDDDTTVDDDDNDSGDDDDSVGCPSDGIYCNGHEFTDISTGECSHGDVPCQEDGLYCNGETFCDEALDRCISTANPCDISQSCREASHSCEDWHGTQCYPH